MSTDLQTIDLKYKIVGPDAGKTISYSKGAYKFVDGYMSIVVREDLADKYKGLTRLLAKSYNAHPTGSKALERAEEEWAANPLNTKGVKNAGGSKPKAGKAKADASDDDNGGDDEAGAGTKGHKAESGDVDGTSGGKGDVSGEEELTLEGALDKLDPEDDAHWTKTGLPNLKVLGEWLGTTVSRGEIEEAVPGFNREMAAENEE